MQERKDTTASALWRAAYAGDVDTVRHLVGEGVDVNCWDRFGRSALVFAAMAGQVELAKLLVEAGAWIDPHEDYDTYHTPLTAALEYGKVEVAAYLLSAGADPTRHAGPAQRTAADYARSNGLEIAEALDLAEDAWRRSSGEKTD